MSCSVMMSVSVYRVRNTIRWKHADMMIP